MTVSRIKVRFPTKFPSSVAVESPLTLDTTGGTFTFALDTDTLGDSLNIDPLVLSGSTSGSTSLEAEAVATGAMTLPAATDTLVGRNTTDTLTNKTLGVTNTVTLKDTLFTLQDDGDATKQAKWQLSGIATATTRTYTLPDANDTLVGKATTDIFTNKTYDTAGTGNSLSINGIAVTANTGTGAVARATSPTFVTPTLGAATATTVNGLVVSGTGGSATFTLANAKTLVVNNTLSFTGTDGTTITFPSTSATMARTDAANTFTGTQTLSGLTASSAVATDGSKNLVSVTNTGSGSNVLGTSPTITTPNIVGTATNDSATAGSVGELISSTIASGSAVSVTPTNTAVNVTSISLTAGDWDVWGNVLFITAATTNITQLAASISTTSATLNAAGDRLSVISYGSAGVVPGAINCGCPGVKARISIASTTTVYLIAQAGFTASTITAWGTIQARRVR